MRRIRITTRLRVTGLIEARIGPAAVADLENVTHGEDEVLAGAIPAYDPCRFQAVTGGLNQDGMSTHRLHGNDVAIRTSLSLNQYLALDMRDQCHLRISRLDPAYPLQLRLLSQKTGGQENTRGQNLQHTLTPICEWRTFLEYSFAQKAKNWARFDIDYHCH